MIPESLGLRIRRAIGQGYYTASGRSEILRLRDDTDRLYSSSREEIETHARTRLAELMSRAARDVPYYRDLIGGRSISPRTAEDVLAGLPILTKSIIRREGDRLLSERPGARARWNTSGGSTGEPVRLLQDISMARESRAFELLFMRWAGHQMGEPHVLIWGVPNDTLGMKTPFRERVFRFVQNETYLNCYCITEELLDEWIVKLNRIRPALIESYVDAIHELCKRVAATGQRVHRPKGIITSAGVLTPQIRASIEKTFGCRVLNRYGSREVSNVACSCGRSDSLHVNEAMAWLEVADSRGNPCPPGQEGDILVSLFINHTMPLIRYRVEDRGVWDEIPDCACGRKTRRLRSIAGRTNDFLVGRDGQRVSGIGLTTLLYPVPGIRQYQFRQKSREEVVLAVVPMEGVSEATLRSQTGPLTQKLEQMLQGSAVNLRFESEIMPSNSGKFRYILNELPAEHR